MLGGKGGGQGEGGCRGDAVWRYALSGEGSN